MSRGIIRGQTILWIQSCYVRFGWASEWYWKKYEEFLLLTYDTHFKDVENKWTKILLYISCFDLWLLGGSFLDHVLDHFKSAVITRAERQKSRNLYDIIRSGFRISTCGPKTLCPGHRSVRVIFSCVWRLSMATRLRKGHWSSTAGF